MQRRPAPQAPATLGSMLGKIKFDITTTDGDVITDDHIRVASYLEKLTEAVADGVLTDEEVAHLADLASVYKLDADTVASAHRIVIEGLVQIALIDSKVTRTEQAELRHLASQLGLSEQAVKDMLADARAARLRQLSEGLPPLPRPWPLGEPLHVGDKVAFTGGDPDTRAKLEEVSVSSGIEVMKSVSRFTTLLVADGTSSTKSAAADKHGVRTVTYRQYTELLRWRQPPL